MRRGVDRIENVEKLSMNGETVGTIFDDRYLRTHRESLQALDEIYRVLTMDGKSIITSIINFSNPMIIRRLSGFNSRSF